MDSPTQLLLPFMTSTGDETLSPSYYSGREIGTFKDSAKAPIHRWFRYPAGFSYKFVLESLDLFSVFPEDWIYDPFSGTGTTLVVAKQQGINAYGVEAHSFVHWVAKVKLNWDFEENILRKQIREFFEEVSEKTHGGKIFIDIEGVFPELVYKCYHPDDLKILYILREQILSYSTYPAVQDFLKLALTETLRGAALAGTGWPYISPRKNRGEAPPKDALGTFQKTVWQMMGDLQKTKERRCEIKNILGDSRQKQLLADEQVKLALTSPPYLNNYDYADRTRLETYFWGVARTWSDITRDYRDKLMIAATTQINRSKYNVETALSEEIKAIAPNIYQKLQTSILALALLRNQKGGKKAYDLMTALYFNDILAVLKETHRVLMPGGHFCLVLGDSAPYGVHVATDTLIGELAVALGFRHFDYYELRGRGEKWKENPQRHNVPLREGIVILKK